MIVFVLGGSEGREESLPHETSAEVIMSDDGFLDYVGHNGYHFTEELADEASRMMDGITWTTNEVKKAIAPMVKGNRHKFTDGDFAYMANMARTDFVPELMSDSQALMYAAMMADDSDGYEGLPMMRWIADLIGKNITSIHWKDYNK